MSRAYKKIAWAYGWFFVGLLFLSYPYALIPPQYSSLAFHVSVPSIFLLTLGAVPVILLSGCTVQWRLLALVGVFLIAVIGHSLRNPAGFTDAVELGGLILIPLAVAVLVASRNASALVRLRRLGFCFWVVNIVLGICSLSSDQEVTGLSGNRNWMASTLLAAAPWAWIYLLRFRRLGLLARSPSLAAMLM